MKAKLIVSLVVLTVVFVVSVQSDAAVFFRARNAQAAPAAGGWQDGYYDPMWGMPLAVLVPPTARWQTDYAWGPGGTRISPINAHFRPQSTGPASAYRMGDYLPAPPQPSDTRQFGDYYVRGPRR
jgi:hypothetical protein